METNDESTSSPRRAWYETGFPAVYLVIGAMFMVSATYGLFVDGRSLPSTLVTLLAGVVMVVLASVTIVLRRRHRQPGIDHAPLAQESDPSLRQAR